ncbi:MULTISPECIES: hypothetical protein [Dactylosporangium]|uniref:YtxH domain-containing protein n=2 Tax=Dactylosporangium TaxID=35753 RepID=A0A9W6KSW4_9ACTN|nr:MULTISPECIES: hypothetical protein [Dactylosporangium]UAB93041.1 hypothetical protein Dvina_32670 [Dactylosporangium vinaceum]UWZ41454.1 hypothetical protein Dmats_27730 [Dactylosporangium matsuzakiense]GLL07013.1 hypothetical protein GCM10017581_087640 [Dactylosporangium matsuzakiense]
MKLLPIAAGLAVGYVLGTRAGRAKYEQIVDNARRLRDNPTFSQVGEAARNLTTPPSTV